MLRTSPTRFGFSVTLAWAGVLVLAGCAIEPQGQSQAEACQLVSAELSSLGSDVSEGLASMTTGDADSGKTAFTRLSNSMESLLEQVDNEPVTRALSAVQDAIGDLASAVNLLSVDGVLQDPDKIAEASTAGAAALAELQMSGDTLNALCTTP